MTDYNSCHYNDAYKCNYQDEVNCKKCNIAKKAIKEQKAFARTKEGKRLQKEHEEHMKKVHGEVQRLDDMLSFPIRKVERDRIIKEISETKWCKGCKKVEKLIEIIKEKA